ncbi:MAG: sensor histidine kinase [Proteobacteria bacterium]|nr:sensor histidine kinase [Pseudomonadota bacterium]
MSVFTLDKRIEEKRKMVLFLGVLLITGFLATSLISYFVSRSSIRQSIINNELPLTSDNIYSEIQRDLLKPIFVSSLMANDTFLKDWIIGGESDIEGIKKYLGEIKRKHNTIAAFFVSEKSKTYYHSQGILKKMSENETRDEWYFRVRSMMKPYELNVDPDMANKDTMTIFINYKVYDFKGNFIGVTGVGLALSQVKKLITTYRDRYNRNIFFFNREGAIVLQSSLYESSENRIRHIDDVQGLERFSSQILAGGLQDFEFRPKGSYKLINIRYIPDLNWILVVEQVEDKATAILRKTLVANLFICLVISIVVLGIIRITIIRYQDRLERRNDELEEKNAKIIEQRTLLEKQTGQLEQANQELKFLNQEKNEFIGITAHDLKSPLNAVVGFAELIKNNEAADEETREIASYILGSSVNIVERINNLLDIGEAETAFEPTLEPFDFRNPVRRTVKDFEFQAQTKKIAVMTLMPDEPIMALANEKWMVEIIGNLVSNAIKYSPKRTSVELILDRTDDTVRFAVVDQGPGIPPEDMPKLFQKYSRATPQPTGDESSTGLGLYIVKRMTKRMGGSTWCESDPGKGSRFIVEFPCA